MMVSICLDKKGFINKDEAKKEIASISKQIAEEKCTLELESAADLIGNKGHTFCPAIFFEGRRRSEYFKEMQLFPVDFDCGISYEVIKERAIKYDLPIGFAYRTFSHSVEKEKFRIVFVHCIPVDNRRVAEMIFAMLGAIFPECDSACKDVARMFFGGREVIEFNPTSMFDIESLAMAVSQKFYEDSPCNASKKVERFAKKNGIGCRNSSLLIKRNMEKCKNDGSSPNCKYNSVVLGENPSFLITYHQDDKPKDCKKQKHKKYRNVEFYDKSKKCILLSAFLAGEELSHNDKFLLATNLLHVDGGQALFWEKLQIAPDSTEDSLNKWKTQLRHILNNDYNMTSCDKCSFCDECRNHKKNLVLTLMDSGVNVVKDVYYDDIEYVQTKIEEEMKQALAIRGEGIHLIKAQTAIGKTRLYCQIVQNSEKPFLIAVPTIKLKREVVMRLKQENGILPVEEIYSIDDLALPEEIKNKIKWNYQRGLPGRTLSILKRYVKKNVNTPEVRGYVEEAKRYLKNIDKTRSYNNCHIVMTHARLLSLSDDFIKNYTVIIDEDILLTCLRNTGEISREGVTVAQRKGIAGAKLKAFLDAEIGTCCINAPYGTYVEEDELNRAKIYENINGLLNCTTFYAGEDHFTFFTHSDLPKGKFIILSATLSEELYRSYFGKTMWVVMYPEYTVKNKGRIIQYTAYSCSRRCLNEKPELFEKIREITGEVETLTFNAYLGKVPNRSGLSITNCAGSDMLKGRDICVVGTPFTRPEIYKIIGLYLGGDTEQEMARRRVTYGQYSFTLMAFEEGILRTLQLYMISSDLEQSVGRARILREDATVYLFSSFPVGQAEIHQNDYLKNTEEADVLLRAHPQE